MKLVKTALSIFVFLMIVQPSFAQYKEFDLTVDGDTINGINQNGQKHGKWVIRQEELRGEPGFEEEGVFRNGEKDGYWRRYSLEGDLLAIEHYKLGGKDGLQQYYSFVGELVREESWRGYNPDAPYDTIAVYGTGSNEIIDFKIVKALPYSVKQGQWKYYQGGMIVRTEEWERNNLVVPNADKNTAVASDKPKKVEKTAEMLEWEKKNKGKKNAIRDGKTGL